MERIKLNFYKVGDIFLTVNSDNPGDRFTGTWTLIAKGRTLVGVDPNDSDFNTVEKTGGSKTDELSNAYAKVGPVVLTGSNSTNGYLALSNKTFVSNYLTNGGPTGEGHAQAGYFYASALGGYVSKVQPYFTCYIWCRTA